MRVFMTSCPGADPGFFLEEGATLRNDFNFVSYLLLLLVFFLDRILLLLESRRSSQGGRGRSVQPLHPSTSTTYLVSFIILNVDRLEGKHLMVG